MVHMQWIFSDTRRIRLSTWTSRSIYFACEFLYGGGGGTQGCKQGGQWWQDTSHGHFSLFYRLSSYVALCFRSFCFKKRCMIFPHEYIYIYLSPMDCATCIKLLMELDSNLEQILGLKNFNGSITHYNQTHKSFVGLRAYLILIHLIHK